MYDIVGQAEAAVRGLTPGQQVDPSGSLIARGQMLSGQRATIGANASGTLTFKTQAPFRPNAVTLTSLGVARGLSNIIVTNIKVGTNEQLVGETNEVPLDVFSPDNLLGRVAFDTAQTAQVVTVSLTNTSSTPETIAGCMFGTRLDRG